MKVRKRLALMIRIDELAAMDRVAVIKRARRAGRIDPYTQRSKEIAFIRQGAVLNLGVDDAADHDCAKCECKSNRTTPEMVVDDHQGNSKHDRYTDNCAHVVSI